MPVDPSEQGRRIRAQADRNRRAMARAAARLFEMAQRQSDLLEEQRLRLAERLRLPRGGTWPPPFGRPRRKPGDWPESGGVPAIPDRPKNLSGGAAAALEFEQD